MHLLIWQLKGSDLIQLTLPFRFSKVALILNSRSIQECPLSSGLCPSICGKALPFRDVALLMSRLCLRRSRHSSGIFIGQPFISPGKSSRSGKPRRFGKTTHYQENAYNVEPARYAIVETLTAVRGWFSAAKVNGLRLLGGMLENLIAERRKARVFFAATHMWRKVFKMAEIPGFLAINNVFAIVCVSQMISGHPWDTAGTAWDTERMENP